MGGNRLIIAFACAFVLLLLLLVVVVVVVVTVVSIEVVVVFFFFRKSNAHTHILDWCACALDGVKIVGYGRTNGRTRLF